MTNSISMSSLSRPPLISHASSDHEDSSSTNYLVYASFCSKEPSPDANVCNWIECYDPLSNSWRKVTTIPGTEDHVLKGFSMVAFGDSIYIIGGRLCHKLVGSDPDYVVEVDLEVLPSVLRFNVHSGSWSKCAPLGMARFDFACTVNEGKIYVAGGQCVLGQARGISSAEVYDPALDEWKPLPSMNTLRYKCVGVTWEGKIHMVGGFAEGCSAGGSWQGPYTVVRSSAEVYDPTHAKWELMARMWELDVPPNQIVAVDGKLFSSGDCLNAWKGHIEAYDRKLNIWNVVDGSHMHALSSPVSTSDATEDSIQRLYLTMAPIGTRLYFLAGYRMPGEISRSRSVVHVFDTSTNGDRWKSYEPTEEEGEKELCCHCCVLKQEHGCMHACNAQLACSSNYE